MILTGTCKIRTKRFAQNETKNYKFHKVFLTNSRKDYIIVYNMTNGTERIPLDISKNDEIAMLTAAQAGSPTATEQIVRRYSRLVRSLAHVHALQGADNEDMIQEGMLGLISAVRNFDADRGVPFAAYARMCVSRRMQSAVRSASAHKNDPLNHAVSLDKPLSEDLEAYPQAGSLFDPESFVIGMEEHREQLTRLFDLLSPFEAQVLKLYLHGLSYDEIACATGKDVKSIDNAIQRIRRKTDKL